MCNNMFPISMYQFTIKSLYFYLFIIFGTFVTSLAHFVNTKQQTNISPSSINEGKTGVTVTSDLGCVVGSETII